MYSLRPQISSEFRWYIWKKVLEKKYVFIVFFFFSNRTATATKLFFAGCWIADSFWKTRVSETQKTCGIRGEIFPRGYKYLNLSAHVYLKASVPEASCLKPSAFAYCWQDFFLSVRRSPFIDTKFSCQWKQNSFGRRCTDWKSSCQSMNLVIFLRIFVFSVSLTRKVLLSNRKPQPPTSIFWSLTRRFPFSGKKSMIFIGAWQEIFLSAIDFWAIDRKCSCQQ